MEPVRCSNYRFRPTPWCVFVDAIPPEPCAFEVDRPLGVTQIADGLNTFQSSPARGGEGRAQSAPIGSADSAMRSSTRCADVGSTPGQQMQEPATRSCSSRRSAAGPAYLDVRAASRI